MQHLDDALIAEWVDGAIAEGSPHYATIGAHVDQCDECRARVEEERALAGHVRQILGVAAPPERLPAFEEVLHRAGTAPRRAPRPGLWMRRLAMAATVVVAGGVGWYARGVVVGTPMETAVRADAADAVGSVEVREVPAERDAAAEEPSVSAAGKRLEVAATDAAGRGAAVADQRQAAEATEAQREVMADEVRDVDRMRASRRDAAAPPATPPPAEPRPMAQMAVTGENELRMQKAALGAWVTTTRPGAERVLGHPLLLVEGLPIASLEMSVDSGAVRVRQDLGGGATLELVQSRAATAEGLAAAVGAVSAEPRERARAGIAVETATIDDISVTARAPVSADSLRVLLSRLRPR